MTRLRKLLFGPERCDDRGPEPERCLLEPNHRGWHKSHLVAWPNILDDPLYWAYIGRRLAMGEMMPHLSYAEMKYALEAAGLLGQTP